MRGNIMLFPAFILIVAFLQRNACVGIYMEDNFDVGADSMDVREIVPLNGAEVIFYPGEYKMKKEKNLRTKRSSGNVINIRLREPGPGPDDPSRSPKSQHTDPIWNEDNHYHVEGGASRGELLHDVRNLTSREIDVVLQTHNDFRRRVTPTPSNMRQMHWNQKLADVAADYVSKCVYAHSDSALVFNEEFGQKLGENIYIRGGGQMNLENAIARWYNEVQYYDRQTGDCSHVCGHYTQVVWAESDEVGCAYAHCRGLVQVKHETWKNPRLLVCNYRPAGNELRGYLFDDKIRAPYKIGEACSQCQNENDVCHDGLCDGGVGPRHTPKEHQLEKRTQSTVQNVADYNVDEDSLEAINDDFPAGYDDYASMSDPNVNDIFFRNITEYLRNPEDLFPIQRAGQPIEVVEVIQKAAGRLHPLPGLQPDYVNDVTTIELSTDDVIDIMLAHNLFRSELEPPAANVRRMHWSVTLADDVMEYITQCQHLQPDRQGDNIKVSQDYWAAKEIIEEWTDEQYGYNWEDGTCMFGTCHRYTQLIWDLSDTIGCARTQCQGDIEFDGEVWERPYVFVCRYTPIGNTLDSSLPWLTRRARRPYTIGEPCDLCGAGDICVDYMCDRPLSTEPEVPSLNVTKFNINTEFRDSVTSYDGSGETVPPADNEISILPCLCENGGQCVPDMNQATGLGAYECQCPLGFHGQYCNATESSCPTGLTGNDCSHDIDECLTAPCYPSVECYNVIGSYVCGNCPIGMFGDGVACELDYSDEEDYVPFPPETEESAPIEEVPVVLVTDATTTPEKMPHTTPEVTSTPPTTQPAPTTRRITTHKAVTTAQPTTARRTTTTEATTTTVAPTTMPPTTRPTTTTKPATTMAATTKPVTTVAATTIHATTKKEDATTPNVATTQADATTTTDATTAVRTTTGATTTAAPVTTTAPPTTTAAPPTTTAAPPTTTAAPPATTTVPPPTTAAPFTTTTAPPVTTAVAPQTTTKQELTTAEKRRGPARQPAHKTPETVERTSPAIIPELEPVIATEPVQTSKPSPPISTPKAARLTTSNPTTTTPNPTTTSPTTPVETTTPRETTTKARRQYVYKMRRVMKCRRTKAGKLCIPVMRRTKYFKDTKEVMIGGRPLKHYIPRGRNTRTKYNCQKKCGSRGKCQKNGMCRCLPKYAGQFCERSACDITCKNKGICVSRNKCVCVNEYTGKSCETFKCMRPCRNGGKCVAPNQCKCPKGYGGELCQTPLCYPECENGGKCEPGNICLCPAGYIGDRCEKVTCKPECQNGGVCTGKDVCSCPPRFLGNRCQISICLPQCAHGGRCMKGNKCTCRKGWRGSHCSEPICMDNCANGGVCIAPNQCKCREGWSGSSCRTGHCERRCMYGSRCVRPNMCRCPYGPRGRGCRLRMRFNRRPSTILGRF